MSRSDPRKSAYRDIAESLGITKDEVTLIMQRWHAMCARCYNTEAISYKNYGGRGVTISPRWLQSKASFVEDVIKLPGFSLEGLHNHTLQLDKDTLVPGNKVYSKDTCVWLDKKDNIRYMPNHMYWHYAYNPLTKEMVVFYRAQSFVEGYHINRVGVSSAASGSHSAAWRKGWFIWSDRTEPDCQMTLYRAVNGATNECVEAVKIQDFIQELGMTKDQIYARVTTTKGYKPTITPGWVITPVSVPVNDIPRLAAYCTKLD